MQETMSVELRILAADIGWKQQPSYWKVHIYR